MDSKPRGRPPIDPRDAADLGSSPGFGSGERGGASPGATDSSSLFETELPARDHEPFPSSLSRSDADLLGESEVDPGRRLSGAPGVLAPGSRFGVYLIGSCIGEGGMARIYQAEHAGLRRQVAIKLLIDGFARDSEGRERFLREARIAAAIKHPNVVNIFDVGLQDDIPYLVMELLEGRDLEKLLEATGALDEAMIIDIMVPVVAGLVAVHDTGIVHRDLKPGNIFLARGHHDELEPKLLDFGISTLPGPEQLKLTTNQTLMGTPFYISPEGMLGGEMTPLSDQYSLGVVMYECATGCTPFTGANLSDLSRLITSGQYTPLSSRKPEVSKRLARIIERAMSVDPEKRYKDLRELGRELLTLAGQRTRMTWGLSFGDIKPTLPSRPGGYVGPSGSAPASTPRWRRPGTVALAIAPLLLALVAVVVWRSQGPRSEDVGPAPPEVVLRQSERKLEPAASGNLPEEPSTERRTTPPVEADHQPNVVRPSAPPSSAKEATPTRSNRANGSGEASTSRRAPRAPTPSAARSTSLASEPEDWVLPPENARQEPAKQGSLGANGAPIFD